MPRLAVQSGPLKGLAAIPVRHGTVAASQTFLRGAVLVENAGRVEEAGVNPALSSIVGVSVHGVTSSALGDDVAYIPKEGNVFEMTLSANTNVDLETIAQADLYAQHGITEDANGVWYVDVDKVGADARVEIKAFKDAVGTVLGRVYVEFL